MDWIRENWFLIVSLALTGLGVWWLMPSSWPRSRAGGVVLALAAAALFGSALWDQAADRPTAATILSLILAVATFVGAAGVVALGSPQWTGAILALVGSGLLASTLHVASGPIAESILFWIFASAALVCAVLMITSRNPVYAALWFALVTFSTCGLFLLQWAYFLAAATVIVYAGAIIVTFLFVMMLAQQAGATIYDQRSRQPLAATIVAFILLGALLYTLQMWDAHRAVAAADEARPAITTNQLSRPEADQSIGTMHGLGRSLFGDYLFAVELAGTLLLVASIGAIAMAPRRAEGTL